MKFNKKILYRFLIIFGLLFFIFNIDKIDNIKNSSSSRIINKTHDQSFDLNKHSIDDPKSIWVIVNKKRKLNPEDFTPENLRLPNIPLRLPRDNPEMTIDDRAATALEEMYKDARNNSIDLKLASGYRSYDLQKIVYESNIKDLDKETTDKLSAKPGHSEHQTGLAFDLSANDESCFLKSCFSDSKEGKWLAKNSYKYGLVVRYKQSTENIVGYTYEPWHFRFVGKELAKLIEDEKVPMENIFNLPPAKDY